MIIRIIIDAFKVFRVCHVLDVQIVPTVIDITHTFPSFAHEFQKIVRRSEVKNAVLIIWAQWQTFEIFATSAKFNK